MLTIWLRSIVFIVLVIVCCADGGTQEGSKAFRQLSYRDGLMSAWIMSIAEDDMGYLWFGGHEGLTRYDGQHCVHYTWDPLHATSLKENRVIRVVPGHAGLIWIGTLSGGLHAFDSHTGEFQNWSTSNPQLTRTPTNAIAHIVPEGDSVLWFSTSQPASLCRLQIASGLIEEYPVVFPGDLQQESHIRQILKHPRDSTVFLLLTNHRIYDFDARTRTVTYRLTFPYPPIHDTSAHLASDAVVLDSTHLLVNLYFDGLVKYDIDHNRVELIEHNPVEVPVFRRIWKSRNGRIWMSSTNSALSIYNPVTNRPEPVTVTGGNYTGLSVRSFYETKNGVLWLGTFNHGALWHDPSANVFSAWNIPRDKQPFEPPASLLYGFLHPTQPVYYVAVRGLAHLVALNLTDYQQRVLSSPLMRGYSGQSFVPWQSGQFLTHFGNTFMVFNPEQETFRPFVNPGLAEILQTLPLPAPHICSDGEQRLAMIFHDRIGLYDASARTWHSVSISDSLSDILGRFYNATFSGQSVILLYAKGVLQFDPESRQLQHIAVDFNDSTMTAGSMRAISVIGDNAYIVDADQGFFEFSIADSLWNLRHHYSIASGLISNNVFEMSMAPDSSLWLSTSLGLVRFDPVHRSFISYSFNQNLEQLYQDRQVVFNRAGYMAVNTSHHVIWSDADRLAPGMYNTHLIINSVNISGQESLAGVAWPEDKPVVLTFKDKSVGFGLACLGCGNSEMYRTMYRIKGFDKEWQTATQLRSAQYSGLPPGSYRLEAQSFHLWNNNMIAALSIPVEVKGPLWLQWWFILLTVLSLAALIYYFMWLKIHNVRKEERIKTEYVKKISELEMSALRAQMNPHFMFNSMNSIKHYILKNDRVKAAEYLSMFSQLIRDILNYSQYQEISLADELKTLTSYIQLEQLRFQGEFEYRIDVAPDLDPHEIAVQPLILQPYVENAIWHGLMHKDGARMLELSVCRANGQLVVSIRDNGIGRQRAMEIRSRSKLHKSYGLQITKTRVQMQNKTSDIVIEDLFDAEGGATGTCVWVYIPFRVMTEYEDRVH